MSSNALGKHPRNPRFYLKCSAAVALVVIALKGAGWWFTGSAGLMSDALESVVNLIAALFGISMLRWAIQPPDRQHPYGHHKAEFFASLVEGMLILLAAMAIFAYAGLRLLEPKLLSEFGVGIVLAVIASVANGTMAWVLLRAGRRLNSIALDADAKHLLTDVWTTAGVCIGLIGVKITGWHWIDPLAALAVALLILNEALIILRRSINGLMDAGITMREKLALREQIVYALTPGFENVEIQHLLGRRSGPKWFVDIKLLVPGNWTVDNAERCRLAIERQLHHHRSGQILTIVIAPKATALPPEEP